LIAKRLCEQKPNVLNLGLYSLSKEMAWHTIREN
jgi:hypothetical protein